MPVRMKKCIACVLLTATVLTGCSMRTVDEMYCLPKRSEAYNDLQKSIDAAMVDLEYCAPLTGEQRQTVQMADLDGDGQQEYLLFAKGNSEDPLQVLIFRKDRDSYVHAETIVSKGTAFDQIEYVQLDEHPGLELVIGRQVNDQVLRSLTVFSFAKGQAQQLVSTGYYRYLTVDLNEDQRKELFVIRSGLTDTDRGVVEHYSLENGVMERSVEVNMSEPVERLKRVVVGRLHDGQAAVYIASTVGANALITDVYTLVNGALRNVTFSNESGTSVKTMRNYYVYADDIDSDGVVELPHLITMVPVQQTASNEMQYLIRWYAMTSNGGEVDKRYTYHDFGAGWYVELSSQWASRISVTRQPNACQFYLWDETFENCVKLMTLYVLTGQNRTAEGSTGNRFVVYATDSTVYAAELDVQAQSYNISRETVINNFHLIRQDWKTGET